MFSYQSTDSFGSQCIEQRTSVIQSDSTPLVRSLCKVRNLRTQGDVNFVMQIDRLTHRISDALPQSTPQPSAPNQAQQVPKWNQRPAGQKVLPCLKDPRPPLHSACLRFPSDFRILRGWFRGYLKDFEPDVATGMEHAASVLRSYHTALCQQV